MRFKAAALSALLLGTGALHFAQPRLFDSIIPSIFPRRWRRSLTYLSGAAEITAGVLIAIPATRRIGARMAAAIFLAVLPANIEAARLGGYRGAPGWVSGPAVAWARVPLQAPLIMWARSVARGR